MWSSGGGTWIECDCWSGLLVVCAKLLVLVRGSRRLVAFLLPTATALAAVRCIRDMHCLDAVHANSLDDRLDQQMLKPSEKPLRSINLVCSSWQARAAR
eukprot:1819437-Amphidinium_carterae.1